MLPRVHGSAVFTRGETQALVSATLGTEDDAQKIEMVDGETYKRFMLHYNFPPFSVGEVQFLRGPGRREVGHGALAERSIVPLLPSEEDFPYTLRVVSDILESNGSSSMASVCGGALALMDAGVPLKAPVAGVAMGLVMDEKTGKWAVLTDIAGAEDHYGDMDFKVAGTRTGITALQMDIKVGGITLDIMRQALEQARQGRLEILDAMATGARRPARQHLGLRAAHRHDPHPDREDPRRHRPGRQDHPRHHREDRRQDRRRGRRPRERRVGRRGARRRRRSQMIQELTATPELDKSYLGRVERITDFGAFIEIMPGVDGLLHVSEIANYRVKDVRDELKEGEQVMVKVINIDPSGKVRLSRKALLAPDEGTAPRDPRPVHDGPMDGGERGHHGPRDRGHDRGGRDRGGRPPRRH